MEVQHRLLSESPDIDRGWAFVVMLCGCLIQFMIIGQMYAMPIFYTTFLEEFDQSPSRTAWTVNLVAVTVNIMGEVANAIIRLRGLRVTVVIGCVISTAGLLACSFAPSLMWILVMYGIVTGVGFALALFASFPAIATYFIKYRAVAFGIASTGVGIGQFVYAPLMRVLVDEYHWRGAFLILAGINFNLLVAAAAMMPPRTPKSPDTEEEEGQCLILAPSPEDTPTALQHLIQQLRSIRLFRRPRWVLFCVSFFATCIGISGFVTHISNYAQVLGHSKLEAAFLPSAIGIAGLCSRIAVAVLAQHPRVHVVGLYMFLFSSVGVVNIVCGFVESYPALVICSGLCGLSVSGYGVLPETVIHIVGVANLCAGVSYSCVVSALGILLGGPVAAWVYEVDPTYRWSFVTVGLVSLFGGLLNLPSWITYRGGVVRLKGKADEDVVAARQ